MTDPATTPKTVLIVDDEPAILKIVSKRLETAGYRVVVAMDGESALARIRESAPELVILDVMMPKLNGYEVCARLKQDPVHRHIPIVMFTAKSEEADYWHGMAAGADAYLTKPFDASDLHLLVNKLIQALEADRRKSTEGPGHAAV